MGFSFATKEYSNGTYVDSSLVGKGNSKGALESIGDSLNDAINENAAKMRIIMNKLSGKDADGNPLPPDENSGASDPGTLALYQQVFAQWTQANQLRANAVAKIAELDTEIMRKT